MGNKKTQAWREVATRACRCHRSCHSPLILQVAGMVVKKPGNKSQAEPIGFVSFNNGHIFCPSEDTDQASPNMPRGR